MYKRRLDRAALVRSCLVVVLDIINVITLYVGELLQYTRYPSTARGISLAVNDRTLDVQVKSDRPSTP